MRPFVDFYGQHRISPVGQDISDLKRHFDRRGALYRHVGLAPALLRGKSVVEFGPGSGYNSIFTASLQPRRYVLVDGNPAGLEKTRDLLRPHGGAQSDIHVVESYIEEFDTVERFDVVFCEGVIPLQLNPKAFLRHVAKFAAPGGVVVITCMDSVSQFAEIMRRIVGTLLVPPDAPIAEKLKVLGPVFEPHLNTLKGRSRHVDDWILDVVIHPWIGSMLSVADAVEALEHEFDVYGASPHFLTDWRWYKDIYGEQARHNELAVAAYFANLHNFLDYRFTFEARGETRNQEVLAICDSIFEAEKRLTAERDLVVLVGIRGALAKLADNVRNFSTDTAESIDAFAHAVDQFLDGGMLGNLGKFASLFGRGQQYLSFIRRP
jgi:SAM-dependent methyltransferase